jgi:hypothetical protein
MASLGRVTVADGTAEALPAEDGSLDAAVASTRALLDARRAAGARRAAAGGPLRPRVALSSIGGLAGAGEEQSERG